MDYAQAISSLYPNASWSMDGESYDGLWWFAGNEDPKPTEEELKKYIAKLKRQAKKDQYKLDRASEYPSVEEQLDMLWHMIDEEELPGKDSTFYKTLLLAKQKYPKK